MLERRQGAEGSSEKSPGPNGWKGKLAQSRISSAGQAPEPCNTDANQNKGTTSENTMMQNLEKPKTNCWDIKIISYQYFTFLQFLSSKQRHLLSIQECLYKQIFQENKSQRHLPPQGRSELVKRKTSSFPPQSKLDYNPE